MNTTATPLPPPSTTIEQPAPSPPAKNRFFSNAFRSFKNPLSKPEPTLVQKIHKIALIIFEVVVSIFFYWMIPSFFAIGFVTGIIADEKVSAVMIKLKDIWNTQPWSAGVLGGVAAAFSLPVALATGSFLWASYLGSLVSCEAQKIIKEDPIVNSNPPPPVPTLEIPHGDEMPEKNPVNESG